MSLDANFSTTGHPSGDGQPQHEHGAGFRDTTAPV